jgi:Flp pilus assembly protein TadG
MCLPCSKFRNANKKGQSLVELALVLPILLLIVFGVLDLGRIFFATINLTNAAREGVRYLTLHSNDVSNVSGAFAGSKAAALGEASYGGIPSSDVQVTVSCTNEDDDPKTCDSVTPATVTVTYDFDLVMGWILPSPITLSRSAVMMMP